MGKVRVVQDLDPTQAGDDFLRVSFHGEEEGTGVFTTIERVVACEPQDGLPWRFRKLFDGLFASAEAAVEVAISSPRCATTISPFVPISMDREVELSVSRSRATIIPTVSAPTYADIRGMVSTTPCRWNVHPRSRGSAESAREVSGT